LWRSYPGAHFGFRARVVLREPCSDDAQVTLRAVHIDARLQPCHYRQEMRIASAQLFCRKVAGFPVVHVSRRKEEIAGHDSEHSGAFAVHQDIVTNQLWVTSKPPL